MSVCFEASASSECQCLCPESPPNCCNIWGQTPASRCHGHCQLSNRASESWVILSLINQGQLGFSIVWHCQAEFGVSGCGFRAWGSIWGHYCQMEFGVLVSVRYWMLRGHSVCCCSYCQCQSRSSLLKIQCHHVGWTMVGPYDATFASVTLGALQQQQCWVSRVSGRRSRAQAGSKIIY